MCAYELIKPSKDYIKEIEDFKKEISNSDSKYKFEGCSGLQNFDDINEWIDKIEAYSNVETCPKDKVPSSLFLFVRDEDDNGNVVDLVEWEKQIRADAIGECCKQISERVKYWDNCAKAVEKGSNEYKIFISLAKNFDELQEQLKEQKNE